MSELYRRPWHGSTNPGTDNVKVKRTEPFDVGSENNCFMVKYGFPTQ